MALFADSTGRSSCFYVGEKDAKFCATCDGAGALCLSG